MSGTEFISALTTGSGIADGTIDGADLSANALTTIAASTALTGSYVQVANMTDRGISQSSPPTTGDATAALVSAITAAHSESNPDARSINLEGRSLATTGVTLNSFTKLSNGTITRQSGTSPLVTTANGVALQAVDKCLLQNVVLNGNTPTTGNVGLAARNHAALVARDLRVQNEGTGIQIRGTQFADFYSAKAYNCKVGVDVSTIAGQGGGNSNYFASLQAIGNEVGVLLWDGASGAYPFHSIELVSPQLLSNSLCALAAFGVTDLEVRGWAAELNGGGASSTGVYSGQTVKRSSVYLNKSTATFRGGFIAEPTISPCFLLENSSHLTLDSMKGYGNGTGLLVATDASSSVSLLGEFGGIGTVQGAVKVNVDLTSTSCLIQGPAATTTASGLPNGIASPQSPGFDDVNGATLGAGGTDAVYGAYNSVVFPASVSGRLRKAVTTGTSALVAFHARASVDTDLLVGLFGNIGNKIVTMRAGEWVRIFWWHTGIIAGGQNVIVSPADSAGATLDVCKWQLITGSDSRALRSQVNTALAGAWA